MSAAPIPFTAVEGAGNAFALFDGLAGPLPADPARAAVELAARPLPCADGREVRLDGLLLLRGGGAPGTVRMIVHNADGGRAAACGNGLRCVAEYLRARDRAGPSELLVETDSGPRRAQLAGGGSRTCRVELGRPRVLERDALLETRQGPLRAWLVDVGNLHAVVSVDDVRRARLAELGRELQSHHRFPAGVNLELVAPVADGLRARVFERGVGETPSCGTGAVAASLFACSDRPPAGGSTRVLFPGGALEVDWDAQGAAWLRGPFAEIGVGSWSGASERPARQPARG